VTDVFISYASEDRERAEELARALEATGFCVWWDRKILTGQTYDEVIERQLETARSVVVLWSKRSISSEWVKNEAAAAAQRGVLLPALIDRVRLPLEFSRKQTADLVDWNGDPSHPGFQALCDGARSMVGGSPQPRSPAPPRSGPQPRRRWVVPTIVAAVILCLVGLFRFATWDDAPAPITSNATPSSVAAERSRAEVPVQPFESASPGPADIVAGRYRGDVIADAKGSSRSDVELQVTKLDKWTVRITSDYSRLGTIDVAVTRVADKIMNAGGDTVFLLDPNVQPMTLDYSVHGEVTYHGQKQ
jgi:hypothetical protein